MLKYRLITGPILILLLVGLVIADDWLETQPLPGFAADLTGRATPPSGLILLGLAILVLPFAASELARVVAAVGVTTRRWLMIVAAEAGLIVSFSTPAQGDGHLAIAILATTMVVLFIAALLTFSRGRNVQGVIVATSAVLFIFVYLGLLLGFLLAIRRDHSAWVFVGVILTTKSCDIGAYFTGRAIGKHRLIEWLSPKKTWEGLAGGVITAGIVGAGLAVASMRLPHADDHLTPAAGALCGVVFAVVGQSGDLVMSLFKRDAGLKDSSSILPGMGGVMDVLDSPLLVAPVAFWMLRAMAGAAGG